MKKTAILLFLVCTLAVGLVAHPHMFLDTRLELDLEENRVIGVELTWWFDPMFSTGIIADYDMNSDGIFDAQEIKHIYDYAFSNLETYEYFTYLTTGEKSYVPAKIKNFNARVEDGTLIYNFYIPFDTAIIDNVFSVAIYDTSYYCDVQYRQDSPVILRGNPDASWEIVQNREKSIQYGGIVSVARQGKTYSGVAFPREVVVQVP